MVKYYGWFYAKIYVFLRATLFYSNSRKGLAAEISRLYFNLFIKGKVV
jgi:hypothetical protein